MGKVELLISAFLSIYAIGNAAGDFTLSVRMISYNNPTSQDYLGMCCDGSGWCVAPCDNFFLVCINNVNQRGCAVKYRTGVFPRDKLNFPKQLRNGLENPYIQVIKGPYHGKLSIKSEVWDNDIVDVDDLVDIYEFNTTVELNRPGKSVAEKIVTLTGSHTNLTLGLSISCAEGYHGDQCDTYCIPNSNEQGHYTCDLNTGAKICHAGWVGANCEEAFDPCKHSKNYDGTGRNILHKAKKEGPFKNDYDLVFGWYRITCSVNKLITRMFAGRYSCGTKNPMFLPKKRPTEIGKEFTADVCMSTHYTVCHMRMPIKIMACKGPGNKLSYVYQLKPSPTKESGYCVE